ncbi:hypothetical protein GUJ93_ZPchr0011g28063 [Zizania palustris]|uniref:Flavin-containing monooxygenase n=1 Tax=Zizania palustris TaxID=103762 RepID=A0A8J5WJI5_ZIZPA|nr:hypothetical protein GUJ93_ZPchr0011g28063 [Zizania palustris]
MRNVDKGAKFRITTCFLIMAISENTAASITIFPGFARFTEEDTHSSAYKSRKGHVGKKVLVVGARNSGENRLYYVGFARRGLIGITMDAKNIADDIVAAMNN